jgi:diaminopimelate decarboxylase
MAEKKLPFSKEKIQEIIRHFPTPFHLYDEKAIVDNARQLKKAFGWNEGFRQYFAVKACPNPWVMKLLATEGFGMDCSSLPELVLAERAGVKGEGIFFSSNDTPAGEYRKARELGAVINLDDITHIDFIEKNAGLPDLFCCRYNPGPRRAGNVIIGDPAQAKYGFTRDQIYKGYDIAARKGIKRFGLHTMIVSNELTPQCFVDTAIMMFDLVKELSDELKIKFEFVNIGGGIGIPYRPEQDAVNLYAVSRGIREAYEDRIISKGLSPLKIYMECGRMITGPYGYLVSTVLHHKSTYKEYIGLDACMANLMRPALYGAYHHITVMGKENQPCDQRYDVTGSLCENNDKFAIDRMLPKIDIGDIVVIHDAGAHGYSMGFNYNGKLRSAELLLRPDGAVRQIRRAETMDDYFATLDFSGMGE